MFSLLHGFWKYAFEKDEFCILILGLEKAGKTTFLEQTRVEYCKGYTGIPLDKITPTVGLNCEKITVRRYRYLLWDLGGQEELQALWESYIPECHALVWLVDASDRESIAPSRVALQKVLERPQLSSLPLLILANKQDLPGAAPASEVAGQLLQNLPKLTGIHAALGISAISADGIPKGFDWLTRAISDNPIKPPRNRDAT